MMDSVMTFLGLPVTAYALCVAGAALLSLVLFFLCARKQKISPRVSEIFAIFALAFGVFFAHLLYCLTQLGDVLEMNGALFLLNPAGGGFMLYGAMLGVALASYVTGKITKERPAKLLDAVVPAAALMIALCRFAEVLDGQGFGMQIFEENLCFFPLAFKNEFDEWYFAIYLFEGLYALLVCAYMLLSRKQRKDGQKALLFLALYCAAQILFETLRRDVVIKWGFVRVSQLLSVILLALMLLVGTIRNKGKKKFLGSWIAFVLLTGLCVGIEFTVDKPINIGGELIFLPYTLTYAIIGASAAALGILSYRAVKE